MREVAVEDVGIPGPNVLPVPRLVAQLRTEFLGESQDARVVKEAFTWLPHQKALVALHPKLLVHQVAPAQKLERVRSFSHRKPERRHLLFRHRSGLILVPGAQQMEFGLPQAPYWCFVHDQHLVLALQHDLTEEPHHKAILPQEGPCHAVVHPAVNEVGAVELLMHRQAALHLLQHLLVPQEALQQHHTVLFVGAHLLLAELPP
mmetsp:Transcript_55734/g.129795  ORF Transcript_55734/g.129795 Transcript_55734/m.129795 type:complete len:204 (+) Transcript_55734:377-988(+)